VFTTQTQIDSFPINYPDCQQIEGDVKIYGDNIKNLNGLNQITSIGGNLQIGTDSYSCDSLENLLGLTNLTTIGGYLRINNCETVINFDGLQNLISIGDGISLAGNFNLENFYGLENLNCKIALVSEFNYNLENFVGLENIDSLSVLAVVHNHSFKNFQGLNNVSNISSVVYIQWNDSLTNFTGLDNVTYIGDDVEIYVNPQLIDISALLNLDTIDGNLTIVENSSLSSLYGLDNIETNTINYLNIYQNSNLSVCNVASICNYINNPPGVINIWGNAEGCEDLSQIADSCGFSLECLPYGNYHFTNQQMVDSFKNNYSNCTKLNGNVWINGEDIVSLEGLNEVDTIQGKLIIQNTLLTNLDGLENLKYVSNELYLGGYDSWPYYGLGNPYLTDISSLSNLSSIGYGLYIKYNRNLSSLSGLDSLNTTSLDKLVIASNENLSECAIFSVCNFLSENGDAFFGYNKEGCNSEEEVEEACLVDVQINKNISIEMYPNPASDKVYIKDDNRQINKISIFNQYGQLLKSQKQLSLDISSLSDAVYIIEVSFENYKIREKLIICH